MSHKNKLLEKKIIENEEKIIGDIIRSFQSE